MSDLLDRIDSRIADLTKQLEALTKFRDLASKILSIMESDSALSDLLSLPKALATLERKLKPRTNNAKGLETLKKIEEVFRSRGNAWMGIGHLAAACGFDWTKSKSAIHRNSQLFESRKGEVQKFGRPVTLWRLVTDPPAAD